MSSVTAEGGIGSVDSDRVWVVDIHFNPGEVAGGGCRHAMWGGVAQGAVTAVAGEGSGQNPTAIYIT